jgi:uncharacterized membrane protein YbhN (UPF0104 family)
VTALRAAPKTGDRRRAARWRASLAPAFNLLLFGASLWAVDHVLREYPYRDVLDALASLSPVALAGALVATALGYLALVEYDWVAFRFVGLRLSFRSMLMPSFVSFAVANSAPANVLTAGGLRYRLYEARGLGASQAAVVAGLNVGTYALGMSALAGITLILRGAGSNAGAPGPPLPGPLTGAALLDWIFSSGALYVLIVSVTPVPFLTFLATFFVAQTGTSCCRSPLPVRCSRRGGGES